MTVTILAVVATLTLGVTGAVNASRGGTAVQQVAGVLDNARARALTGLGEVVVAFADNAVGDPVHAYRSMMVCEAVPAPEGEREVFRPVSGWYVLPEGFVFATCLPASGEAGQNLFGAVNHRLRVRLPGEGRDVAELPCLRFGRLGAVVSPRPPNGAPVLVAVAEGALNGVLPMSKQGGPHTAAECRWVAVQANSGSCLILP